MASKKINDSAKENLPKGGRSKFSTSLDDSQKRKIQNIEVILKPGVTMPCHSFHIVIITPQLFLTHSSPNMCLHILLLYEARQSAIQTLYVCAHLYLEIFENVFYIFQKCISRKARFSLRSQIFPFVRLEKRIWQGWPQF